MKKTDKEILDFLKSMYLMSIATMSDDRPHSSIMLYTMDDNFNIYFATHEQTYKSKNLQKNPHMSLSIWNQKDMLVQADAEVKKVTDAKEQEKALDALAEAASKDSGFWPPLFRTGGEEYIIFKAKPFWLRALDLQIENIGSKESPFTEVDLTKYE